MGFEPQAYSPIGKTFFSTLDKWLELLDATCKEATTAHAKVAQAIKEQIGMKLISWKIGAKIWLDSHNLKINFPSRKLAPWWEGLFEISQVISPYAYCLHLYPTWKIHKDFHAFLLSSFTKTPEFSPNFIPQSSELIQWEEEYKVDTICAHQGFPGQWQYLVSWKGYSCAEDTWEPESDLGHASFILQAYKPSRSKDFPMVTSL